MEEKISFKGKALERERMRLDSAPDVWQLLGLNLTILETPNDFSNCSNGQEGDDEGKPRIVQRNCSFEFSKIDPADENRLFVIKVSISSKFLKEKNSSCFKIYESDPVDLFSSPEIDSIENEAGSDSRRFIILLRKHIESKVASKKPTKEKIPQPPKEKIQPTKEKIQPTKEEKTSQKSGQAKDDGALKENGQPKNSQLKSSQPKSSQPPKEGNGTKIPVSKIPLAR